MKASFARRDVFIRRDYASGERLFFERQQGDLTPGRG
jgi:hypothetical protein